ncbi:unnamed protein product [Fusarium graminearum]|uniref:Uncharacterized protein n=1 Tax=Gibberella zeae TaxID=5518 RepID=A0A4E9DYT2_GIBZA|nr:unnamed protein product [Fusarium graminearum]CAF3652907.1 unnamed protein product [Fusarium graminearum]CAG1980121.1 unnamed protein product [Fusarium graminearum]CAG1995334.1 unnamed protein product [Fusarium graminearum]
MGNETTVGVTNETSQSNREGNWAAGFGMGDVPGCAGQKAINQGSVQRRALELLNKGGLVKRNASREGL